MNTSEEQLVEARMKEYAEATKDNTNVDKAALAMAALESVQFDSDVSVKRKKMLYTLSLCLPPIGFAFAAWYYFSKKIDGKRVALICIILTVLSGLLAWLVLDFFTSSLPPQTAQQIKSLNLSNTNSIIQDLIQQ
jgi:uncharacterized membrane-anchored protein